MACISHLGEENYDFCMRDSSASFEKGTMTHHNKNSAAANYEKLNA
jgi:hypothetical protein